MDSAIDTFDSREQRLGQARRPLSNRVRFVSPGLATRSGSRHRGGQQRSCSRRWHCRRHRGRQQRSCSRRWHCRRQQRWRLSKWQHNAASVENCRCIAFVIGQLENSLASLAMGLCIHVEYAGSAAMQNPCVSGHGALHSRRVRIQLAKNYTTMNALLHLLQLLNNAQPSAGDISLVLRVPTACISPRRHLEVHRPPT